MQLPFHLCLCSYGDLEIFNLHASTKRVKNFLLYFVI